MMESDTSLSQRQEDIAREAVRRGYFSVPRETTLGELSTHLGFPDTVVSAELRRVTERLIIDELDL